MNPNPILEESGIIRYKERASNSHHPAVEGTRLTHEASSARSAQETAALMISP